MEHNNVIYPETLDLLRKLLDETEFNQFCLCGVTVILMKRIWLSELKQLNLQVKTLHLY